MQITKTTKTPHLLSQLLKTQSHVFYAGEHCGAWRSAPEQKNRCVFHFVMHGECSMQIENQPAQPLKAGEIVVFLRATAHQLQASTSQPTRLICGYMDFVYPLSTALLQQLPTHLHYHTQQQSSLRHVMALIQEEVRQYDLSSSVPSVVLPQLCDVMLSYLLRDYLEQPMSQVSYGLISLAQDPVYGVLLEQLWQKPAENWDVAAMAELVHVSKASFHRRLKVLTGLSPTQLLSTIRLYWAQYYLQQNLSVEQTAEQVGYSSASALTQVFKRELSLSPAQWREQQLAR